MSNQLLASDKAGPIEAWAGANACITLRDGRAREGPNRVQLGIAAIDTTPVALPDPAVCQATSAGFGDYADCRVEHPFVCPHAMRFGSGYFCLHPERNEIVRRTKLKKTTNG